MSEIQFPLRPLLPFGSTDFEDAIRNAISTWVGTATLLQSQEIAEAAYEFLRGLDKAYSYLDEPLKKEVLTR